MKGSQKQRKIPISEKVLEIPLPELLVKVSRRYYIEERLQKEIASELGYKKNSSVTRLLKEARERGVIEFNVDGMFAIGGRKNESLSQSMRDSFDLDEAIVVAVDHQQAGTEVQDKYAKDDYLHIALANYTGLELRRGVRAGDHIGVGSGRAVHQAMRVIKRRPPSRKHVRITPLSGRIWTRFWEARGSLIKRPLDADDAARMLALAFENEPGTVFSQIAYPLFISDHEKPSAIMNEHSWFLPDGSWRDAQVPTRAFVGVGVVDPNSGHRFADLLRSVPEPPEMAPYLKRAAGMLKDAINLVERSKLPFFGDVTNRLFPVLPLPEELDAYENAGISRSYDKIINALDRINQQMVVVKWEHLRKIPSVMAIAGGEFKVKALWTLLLTRLINPSKRTITELSTDSETAKRLLGALESYDRNPKIQNWYRQMVQKLF
ncbi:MAG: hypothetical protein JST85_28355 [Acidobacteria bacterium]|nr:hypothetical protein [Acidobacteriota bacterium]